MKLKGYTIKITGIVQGVGFRPFIYNLAKSLFLKGEVYNLDSSVIININSNDIGLNNFIEQIKMKVPPLAKIKDITITEAEERDFEDFTIKESIKSGPAKVFISPDVALCSDCRKELFSKNDRRYGYPFINCTNCGPRFTIVKDVPYDRKNTTMNIFPMCEACKEEYTDPTNRRYHAQPVSCFDCGPALKLYDSKGKLQEGSDVIDTVRKSLKKGKIVAIKGLGGYHLACDAQNKETIKLLRDRKYRDQKAFAVMVGSLDEAEKHCVLNKYEKELLLSPRSPIVILKRKEGCVLPEELAPHNKTLGLMLPYTPLHMMLFDYDENGNLTEDSLCTLVMTSGNISNQPICFKDEEAIQKLGKIADYILIHNREIHIRTDDSVSRIFREKEYIIRRSRGYVPQPITLNNLKKEKINILACGGELKSTFCLYKEGEFYISHHIGDLENMVTFQSFRHGIEHFKKLFDINPEVIAYDMHPEYLSTKYALDSDIGIKIPIQHHHAHVASAMAENNLDGHVIGISFDGTGYGTDGMIWGGEIFTGGYEGFERFAHLEYVPLPGGEAAVRQPWRMAMTYLKKTKVKYEDGILDEVDINRKKIVSEMIDKYVNCPFTSSMGRLFDAVSALLGICYEINYEGQAAIELEQAAERTDRQYGFDFNYVNGVYEICVDNIIKSIIEDVKQGIPVSIISGAFHKTVAVIVLEICRKAKIERGLARVVLSGGVFQNITLLELCCVLLERDGFEVYHHSQVPSNDGGISLGQAVMALYKISKNQLT